MEPLAIVIQCFNKPDTLRACCESLLGCADIRTTDLIFWIDSAVRSRKPEHYASLTREVRDYINDFTYDHTHSFRSIKIRANSVNLGTCKTCQTALDYAFSMYPFVLFAEDDIVFAPDALGWFRQAAAVGLAEDDSVWAVSGESIFFNARGGQVTPELKSGALSHARFHNLYPTYTYHSFIPSSCFATTDKKWAEFGVTRGQPLGDVDLCNRCADEQKRAVFPIIPRVRDIGMLHKDGFSVTIKGADNVSELKQTYLTSADLAEEGADNVNLKLFDGDAGLLYRRSTLLEGFSDFAPA